MRKQSWTKRDPIKNYFPLPNEIYDLGLSRGAISVYSFLLRQEDRKTYQCLLSYPRVIPRMAARCTTPAAAMHHFGGMGAPFQRWLCTIICGQVALFERRTQIRQQYSECVNF